jgi:stage III sporulation protein SpoIIIAA/intein/homing endonuclease
MQKRITDDLHDLLQILPPPIAQALLAANRTEDLLEIVLDLGRVPSARYVNGEVQLATTEITPEDLTYTVGRVRDFDADNRAGIERTLHRISAIRNRRGNIVGLTCRVGRAVYGTTDVIKDLIESGKSILLLGRPGVGKCITGDSLILTRSGLMSLAELIPANLADDEFTPITATVFGRNGLEAASQAYNGGRSPTIRLTTRQGFQIEGTLEHPLLALTEQGQLEFRRLNDLKPGDHLAIQRGQQCFGSDTKLPVFEFKARTNALDGKLPSELTEDLARYLGYLVAEGTLSYDNQVAFCNTDPEIQADMVGLTEALFGLQLRRHLYQDRWNGKDFRTFGVKLRRFLSHLGLTGGHAADKQIPPCILTAPKAIVSSFLRSLFEGDGSIYGPEGRIELASASYKLLSQVHVLLLNYGIVGNLRVKHNTEYDRDYYYLTLIGENVLLFADQIGFLSTTKHGKLDQYAARLRERSRNPNLDIVPHQNDRLRQLLNEVDQPSPTLLRYTRSDNRAPSYRALSQIVAESAPAVSAAPYQSLQEIVATRFFFDPIKQMEESEAYVYDLTVPHSHSFFANGFVSHNTTMLREAARLLGEQKRVVIVDTSNEIGGDGDVPHPAVGRARRMQVAQPSLQHEVMIEAVENHNPEVIVIDEIGRELEAEAARTINERGVQLIGTAHGQTLDNLLLNPTLADLVGGIESVTLSDEEARRRGTQKTVLERRSPPTFDVLIEIQDRQKLTIHLDVGAAVDGILRGRPLPTELRYEDNAGAFHTETVAPPAPARGRTGNGRGADQRGRDNGSTAANTNPFTERPRPVFGESHVVESTRDVRAVSDHKSSFAPISVYAYGITRQRLEQAARRLKVPLHVVEDLAQATALVTLKTYYRRHQRPISDAEERGLAVYVLRSNSITQMENFVAELFNVPAEPEEEDEGNTDQALNETQSAIQAVLSGSRTVDLSPQSSTVRRLQHDLARQHNLISHSYGKEPYRRVRIFRE